MINYSFRVVYLLVCQISTQQQIIICLLQTLSQCLGAGAFLETELIKEIIKNGVKKPGARPEPRAGRRISNYTKADFTVYKSYIIFDAALGLKIHYKRLTIITNPEQLQT